MLLKTLGRLSLEGSEFARPKPLLLLAYLAVEGAQGTERLAELFWPRANRPRRSLTVALVRLRQGAPGTVQSDGEKLWGTVDADVKTFLSLVERGDHAAAVESYTGRFLDGFYLSDMPAELEEWIHQTREFLAGNACNAALQLAEREAAGERFEAAARLAEQGFTWAAGLHEPETLTRLHTLMIAGSSPKAPLVAREGADFGIDLSSTRAEAQKQLREEFGSSSRPPGPGNLPARAAPFVGRDLELTEIATLLAKDDCRLLTLIGPPGIGKTYLGLQVAREQQALGAFPGGIYLVRLEALKEVSEIPVAMARALGVQLHAGRDPLSQLAEHLADKKMLLVFDNFEHLVGGSTLLSGLVERCPNLALLVTSRERLNLAEEWVFVLSGLPFPERDELAVSEAERFDAVQLFLRRARRARPGYSLSHGDLQAVLKLCRALEGLPLALELAAIWMKVISAQDIVSEIEKGIDFLATPIRDVAERHRSLRSAFEHSWHLLGSKEQQVLRRLAVCQGGFTREAASRLAAATIPVLASLIDKSLLRSTAAGRYDFHPLVQQYAREKLAAHGERGRAEEAHIHYYFGLLRQLEEELAGGEQQAEAVKKLECELENIHAAWHWAVEHSSVDALWTACRPLQLFYIQHGGLARVAAKQFSSAAARLNENDPEHQAVVGRLQIAAAWFTFLLNEYDRSATLAARGLRLLQPLLQWEPDGDEAPGSLKQGDLAMLGRAACSGLNTLGNIARRQGDFARAGRYLGDALQLARRQRNLAQIAIVVNNLAGTKMDVGDYTEAEHLYEEVLSINRKRGNSRSVVRNLTNLAGLKVLTGEARRAEQLLGEALRLAREIGFRSIVPDIHLNLGGAAYALGQCDTARAQLQEALDLKGQEADRAFFAAVQCRLARVACAEADSDQALQRFSSSYRAASDIGESRVVNEVLIGLAELFASLGERPKAARLLGVLRKQKGVTRDVHDRSRRLAAELEAALGSLSWHEAVTQGAALESANVLGELLDGAQPHV